MTSLQEIHHQALQANGALARALTASQKPAIQMAETLQALHDVIAAIDAIYLHLKEEEHS